MESAEEEYRVGNHWGRWRSQRQGVWVGDAVAGPGVIAMVRDRHCRSDSDSGEAGRARLGG